MNRRRDNLSVAVAVLLFVALTLWAPLSVTSQGSIRKVYAGGTSTAGDLTYTPTQLQNAIDDAAPGDTIYIQNDLSISAPGGTSFVLRQKSCPAQNDTCWITITGGIDSTGAFAGTYPAAGVRIGPSNAASLPDIIPSVNNYPAIRTSWPSETGPGCSVPTCVASYWRLKRLEIRSFSPWNGGAMLVLGTNNAPADVTSGDNQNLPAEIPHHIDIDQVYIHGDPIDGQHRGLTNAAKFTTMENSYVDDIKSVQETQAVNIINTTGPQSYINNYFAATGETFFTGGGDGYLQFSSTITGTPTTTAATLSVCPSMGTSANHQWFTIEVGGTEYFRMVNTINTSTCAITWTEPLPGIPDTPGDVHWTLQFGGLLVEKNLITKKVSWRDPIQAGPTGVTATATTGGTLTASAGNCYRVMSRQKTTNDIMAQSSETAEQCATTTSTNNAVNLSWTASANADEYVIYWRLGNTTRKIATVNAPTTSYSHTSPTAGTQVVGTPQSPTVTPVTGSGGTLAAGTYHYRIIAYPNEQPATADLVCTLSATGRCDFTWSAVTGATSYRIYGRQDPQNQYTLSTTTSGSDVGGSNNSSDIFSFDTPTVWIVKNTLELKNCDGLSDAGPCVVRGNIIENSWLQAQTGMVVNIKLNNQNFTDDGAALRNFTFENNIVRHGTRAFQICAYDCDGHGSGLMEDGTIKNNLIYDIGSSWGTNQSTFYFGYGFNVGAPASRTGQRLTVDHNTILNDVTNYGPALISSDTTQKWADLKWTNNIERRGQNGWHALFNGSFGSGGEGTTAWNNSTSGTNRLMNGNVHSGALGVSYPDTTISFFPDETTLQACFTNYAGGDYSLASGCAWNNAGTDSLDIGADIALVNAYTSIAASGDNSGTLSIVTTTLPDGTVGTAYSQTLSRVGGTAPFTWTVQSGTLPTGLSLSTAGVISGTPSGTPGTATFTVRVTDTTSAFDDQTLALTVNASGGGGSSAPVWNSSNSNGGVSPTSVSVSMTPAGTNRYMVCGVFVQSTARNATSVVFNGTESLTFQRARNFDNGSGIQARAEYWDIINPSAVTANVVATMNLATATVVGCSVYTNVNQTTPLGTFADNGGNSALSAVTFTSATNELSIDVTSIRVGTTGVTEGAGQTNRVERQSGSGAGNVTGAMSQKTGVTSATHTWSVDDSTSKSWASIGVSLKGVSGGPPPTPLTITSTSPIATGQVGVAYTYAFAATGGTAPYTWSLVTAANTLPAGVTLSSGGTLSGTPTSTLTKTFTVRVTDAAAATADGVFSVRMLPVRPISVNGLERNVYSTAGNEPALSNNRVVMSGDLWNDEILDQLKRRRNNGTWETLSAGQLASLGDVSIVAPTNNQSLRYDEGTNKWANVSVNTFTQGGNAFGTTAILGTSDSFDINLIANGTVRLKSDNFPGVALRANGDNNPELYVSQGEATDWMNLGFNAADGRRIVGQVGGGTNRSYQGLAGAVSGTDYIWGIGSSTNSGGTNTRWAGVRLDGLFSIKHLSLETGAKPTCSASERGTFWYVAGGAGVKDTVEVCAKDASNAYAWRTIY